MGLLKAGKTAETAAHDTMAAAGVTEEAPRLDHPDAALRRRAVQALAGDTAQIATLVDVLRHEDTNAVRQAAFVALAGMNSADAAEGVAELLADADPALRNGALETLATMPEHAGDLLEPLGRHADPDVRIFAVLLAAELDHLDTAGWLITLAHAETDANVCSNLAEALGGSGNPGAIPVLEAIAARFSDEPFLGFAVETAIHRLREA